KEHLFVFEVIGNFTWTIVGIRYAHIFGLSARITPVQVCVPKKSSAFSIQETTFWTIFGVRTFALRWPVVFTKPAPSTRDRKGNHNAISLLQILHLCAHLFHYSHELMPQRHRPQLRKGSIVDMQV